MSEEISEELEPESGGAKSADPAAIALALPGASRGRADKFLKDQSEMLHLQMEELREEKPLKLSHLRWQRFNDQMKGALQIMTVVVGFGVAVIAGAFVWDAAH